ncbi:hypothetical protein H1R20_g14130, partial [Candolleomyces eurysporus]
MALHNKYDRMSNIEAQAQRDKKVAEMVQKETEKAQGQRRAAEIEAASQFKHRKQVEEAGAIYNEGMSIPLNVKKRTKSLTDEPSIANKEEEEKKIVKTVVEIEVSASEDDEGDNEGGPNQSGDPMDVDPQVQGFELQPAALEGVGKKKKGVIEREKVQSIRNVMHRVDELSSATSASKTLKRAALNRNKNMNKNKTQAHLTGVRKGWDRNDNNDGFIPMPQDVSRATSTTSGSRQPSTVPSNATEQGSTDDELDDQGANILEGRGLASDGEDDESGEEFALFRQVKGVVNQAISSEWKNRLAKAAITALDQEYSIRGLEATSDRSDLVRMMMGPNDRVSKKRPFLWKGTDEVSWKGESVETLGGLFLGRMTAKVLAEHLSFMTEIHPEILVPSDKPRGALMMSILAVTRALEYSLTGILKVPSGKSGYFSEENWGDYEGLKNITGSSTAKRVHIKRATVFKSKIDSLKDEHWKLIIKTAKSYLGKKKDDTLSRAKVHDAPGMMETDASDSGDEDLFDPMFDAPVAASGQGETGSADCETRAEAASGSASGEASG